MHRLNNILALSTLLLVSICSAQQTATTSVPNLIRYSGSLKDAQGAAFSSATPVGVTFSIYKQQDGGAAVWMETQNVTPDRDGQYNVILGSTTATGLPDDLFSQQEQRWLGVQVEGQEEQARVLLVSVPYAFKAHEADTLGGLPASAFVKMPAGSTTVDSGTALNALNNISTGNNGGGTKGVGSKRPPSICTPVPGALILWDAQGSECPSNFFQNLTTGNIGIGLTNPSEPLDVVGEISTYSVYGIKEHRILGVNTLSGLPTFIPPTTNLFVGWQAGGSDVTAQANGSENTFTGFQSGFLNNPTSATQGIGNTYDGALAGQQNKTGSYNTMIGDIAGSNNLDNSNTCVGYFACQQHQLGSGNTMVGKNAGVFPSTGKENSFFGDSAGQNDNGDQNTFTGVNAGQNNQGDGNAFFGYDAGMNNQPAVDDEGKLTANSFLGYKAGMSNTTGFHNTFIGYKAGMSNTTSTFGVNNTFLGFEAGMSNTVSAGNTFVGTKAGRASGAGTDVECCNTYIGNNAGMTAHTSNNTFLGYRAGEISLGHDNTFAGVQVALHHQSGDRNVFLGTIAGWNMVSGSNNTFVGPLAGYNVLSDSNIMIGSVGKSTDVNTVRLGTVGSGDLQGDQDKVFVEPIVLHNTTYQSPMIHVVTIDPSVGGSSSGQLGWQDISTGGGGVMGNCGMGANWITRWTGTGTTVDCSHIYELQSNFFLGVNVGSNPQAALDVNGQTNSGINTTDTRSSYMIGLNPVLTVNPLSNNNLFLGVGAGLNNPLNTGTGTDNTMSGFDAGFNNTGSENTFSGSQAGQNITSGGANTFTGYKAGVGNSAGATAAFNTVTGAQSGSNLLDGTENTITGAGAGQVITGGSRNTCNGMSTCEQITTTELNSCFGREACQSMSGSANTVLGAQAGANATTGDFNILIGAWTANNPGAISNDIYIGSDGPPGFGESNTIRIGGGISGQTTSQTDTYIAGIFNSTVGPAKVVCVDALGKLGTSHPGGCSLSLQDTIKTGLEQLITEQRQQIESLQKQNAEFQQRLARLEALIEKK